MSVLRRYFRICVAALVSVASLFVFISPSRSLRLPSPVLFVCPGSPFSSLVAPPLSGSTSSACPSPESKMATAASRRTSPRATVSSPDSAETREQIRPLSAVRRNPLLSTTLSEAAALAAKGKENPSKDERFQEALQEEMRLGFLSRLDEACRHMLRLLNSAPPACATADPTVGATAFDEKSCLLPLALSWGHSLASGDNGDTDAASGSPCVSSLSLPRLPESLPPPPVPSFRECGDAFEALEPFMEKVLLLPPRPNNASSSRFRADISSASTESVAAETPQGRLQGPEGNDQNVKKLFPPVASRVLQRIEALLERSPVGLIGVARFGAPDSFSSSTLSSASSASPSASPSSTSSSSTSSSSTSSSSTSSSSLLSPPPLSEGDPQVLVVRPLMASAPSAETERKRKRGQESSSPLASSLSSSSGVTALSYKPFPTTFWLCDERLRRDVSTVEVRGGMKVIQERICGSRDMQKALIADHLRYIAIRWLLIETPLLKHFYEVESGRKTGFGAAPQAREGQREGGVTGEKKVTSSVASTRAESRAEEPHACPLCRLLHVLRERGIGGISTFCSMRCLHMHYAFHLVLPPTTVGALVDEELAKLEETESTKDSDL